MAELNNFSAFQLAGGAAASLIALAFLLQKFLLNWRSDKAESSVLNIMHTELERMAEQNSTLSRELGKLQGEIIELNSELRKLTAENQRLHAEVAALTSEVSRLQAILQRGTTNGSTS